jgi:hypothetical protein
MTIVPHPHDAESADTVRLHWQGEPFMETSHINALQQKHAGIEQQIHAELTRPMPDAAAIQALKKKKLRIKEEIARH